MQCGSQSKPTGCVCLNKQYLEVITDKLACLEQASVDIRQDCIEALQCVISRFGGSLTKPWPVTELLLKELEDSRSGLQKKALLCIRAHLLTPRL